MVDNKFEVGRYYQCKDKYHDWYIYVVSIDGVNITTHNYYNYLNNNGDCAFYEKTTIEWWNEWESPCRLITKQDEIRKINKLFHKGYDDLLNMIDYKEGELAGLKNKKEKLKSFFTDCDASKPVEKFEPGNYYHYQTEYDNFWIYVVSVDDDTWMTCHCYDYDYKTCVFNSKMDMRQCLSTPEKPHLICDDKGIEMYREAFRKCYEYELKDIEHLGNQVVRKKKKLHGVEQFLNN